MSMLKALGIKEELTRLETEKIEINLNLVGIRDKNREADLRLRLFDIAEKERSLREELLAQEPPVEIEGLFHSPEGKK